MNTKKYLSFIIPVFNEEESLNELYKQIKVVIKDNRKFSSYEIIFINDGSTDKTLEVIKDLHKNDKNIEIISFRRNLGKAQGLNEGFKKAKGEIIVTLDGDLQDGPENIPLLIEKLQKGFDIVVGWKKKRNDSLNKIIPSRAFNYFVRIFSHIPLHDFNSGLKVMKVEVAKELHLYGEFHRFIPVLAVQRGFKVSEVAVIHHVRKYGSSKYGWQRLFKGFFDFLTVMFLGTYSEKPFHLFGLLGIISILIGIIIGIDLSVLHFQGVNISRRPLLILSVLLIITGLQMVLSGLLAEIIISKRSSPNGDSPIDYET